MLLHFKTKLQFKYEQFFIHKNRNLTPGYQCFPRFFARRPLLASKNNNGSSQPCSCKHRVSRWQVSKISNLYLRTDCGQLQIPAAYMIMHCITWP